MWGHPFDQGVNVRGWSGFPSDSDYIVYPSSCHNTDSVFYAEPQLGAGLPRVTCHMPPVTCHLSPVTKPTARATHPKSKLGKLNLFQNFFHFFVTFIKKHGSHE